MKCYFLVVAVLLTVSRSLIANAQEKPKPADTEFYTPIPVVVTPGVMNNAPSDAIILFDGKNLNEWVSVKDNGPAKWILNNGVFTVDLSTYNNGVYFITLISNGEKIVKRVILNK